jgi:hypothetical protein
MKTACVLTKHFSAMKIWLNEFLENAAFPAVILAFACAPINNKIPDLRASRLTDQREVIANRGSRYQLHREEAANSLLAESVMTAQ